MFLCIWRRVRVLHFTCTHFQAIFSFLSFIDKNSVKREYGLKMCTVKM